MLNLSPSEQRKLFSSDFGKVLLRCIKDLVFPIFWQSPDSGQWKIIDSGSGFILQIDDSIYGITAGHVMSGFECAKKNHSEISAHLRSLEFDLQNSKITTIEENGIDISTFRISKEEKNIVGKNAHVLRSTDLPLPTVAEGERLLVCGFPAQNRHLKDQEVEFGAFMFSPPVASVGESGFYFQIEREHYVDTEGHGLPGDSGLGALSGAPVFRLSESDQGILHKTLAGVVGSSISFGETIKATHASVIRDGGEIVLSE